MLEEDRQKEENALVVPQVPLDHVSHPQLLRHKLAISELEELLDPAVAALIDEVGSGVDVGTVAYSRTETLDIVRRDAFGVGEDLADSFGNGDLCESDMEVHRQFRLIKTTESETGRTKTRRT